MKGPHAVNVETIARRRMLAQGLWGRREERPEDVVRRLVAMQAQDFAPAKWAVGQRTGSLADRDVERAFAEGTILRTHVLRPTWHFVLPEDLRWLLALTAPRILARMASRQRELGLDTDVRRRANRAFERAVAEGPRTRDELARPLEDTGIDPSGQRLPHLLMLAELDGVLVSGPRRGKQHTYVAYDARVPPGPAMSWDEALALLARRYFASRGPATLRDFLKWSSLTAAEGRRGLEAVAGELERIEVDGRTYWFDPWVAGKMPPSPVVDLVHVYDEIVIAYSESRDVLSGPERAGFVTDRGAFLRVILLDGRMVGRWREVRRRSIQLEVTLYVPLSQDGERMLRAALERYGAFLGEPVALSTREIA
uniref:Winged helix DNA-binding domain-containing protein n=1 Tax=Thermorudis peleae TaxID=1382356 RepID=A0A831X1J5_9BACT